MKIKNWFLLTGLVLSGLVWNGCYTQLARPDREEDTQVARESEPVEEEVDQYSRQEQDYQEYGDDRHVTNVYIYDDWWYRPYWYSPAWSWYHYPRSRFYVSFGFGYYDPFDPWGWCGTPWSWYGPRDYYWNPYYSGWHHSNYYGHYYPRVIYGDRNVDQRKRTITRRGSSTGDDNNSAGTYAGSSGRGSLARPVAGTYARGDDGSYRRIRRTDATTIDRRSNEPASVSGNKSGSSDNSGRRAIKRSSSGSSGSGSGGGETIHRRPVKRGNSGSSGDSGISRRGSSGSSGSGGSVARPSGNSGSSGRSAPPPSSSGSSGKSGSSDRRKRN
jgi:hypothetical protein